MAHRILGLDIGATAVRVAIVDKTLRQTTLTGWDEEAVGDVDAEAAVAQPTTAFSTAQQEAVRRLLARVQRPDDVLAVGLPAQHCLHRTLSFPFRDDKAIEEAVGFELENHIPTPISDLIVDYIRLGEQDGQTEVLAVAAPRKEVERHLDATEALGLEVRRFGLQSLAYASLVRLLPEAMGGVTLLLDIGTRNTEVVVTVDGRTQMLRSFAVGSATVAGLFASLVNSDLPPDALLAQHANLLPDDVLESDHERAVAAASRQAMQPLLRELRVTLSAWQRRAHKKPDRILLTGGLSRLSGLHEFIERALAIAVAPVQLEQLPDTKLGALHDLGDRGTLAVALALSAADTESDGDVDFRKGDLAFEGDFTVLRQRLPRLAAFAVIALCLLGIRASLNYRALAIEQAQQLERLQAVSKQWIGKSSSDFDSVKRELERPAAVDMAALYPDLSAFKVLEEVSAIVDKVTEPPDFKGDVPPLPGATGVRPPGPEEPVTPQPAAPTVRPDPAQVPPVVLRGLPQMGGRPPMDQTERAEAASREAEAARMDGPGGDPAQDPAVRAAAERVREGGNGAAEDDATGSGASGRDAEGGNGAASGAAKGEFAGHQVELSSVQIERGRATLRGDADTQDALLALQQAIDAHRCFGKVKSSSDRISFERHRDWFKFTVEFEVACPASEAATKGAKKGSDATNDGDKAEADGEGEQP